jgi:hypothetical protein
MNNFLHIQNSNSKIKNNRMNMRLAMRKDAVFFGGKRCRENYSKFNSLALPIAWTRLLTSSLPYTLRV